MVTDKVLTKKEGRLYNYEMVVIISPELADEQLETAINNVTGFITSRGGTVSEITRWGKRDLAYPIKHFVSGYYILTKFTLKPTFCKELENTLKISEQILRHLLIKLESKPVEKPSLTSA